VRWTSIREKIVVAEVAPFGQAPLGWKQVVGIDIGIGLQPGKKVSITFTKAAEERNRELVKLYLENWERHREHSEKYSRNRE